MSSPCRSICAARGYRTAGTGKLHLSSAKLEAGFRRVDPERRPALRRHRPGGAAPALQGVAEGQRPLADGGGGVRHARPAGVSGGVSRGGKSFAGAGLLRRLGGRPHRRADPPAPGRAAAVPVRGPAQSAHPVRRSGAIRVDVRPGGATAAAHVRDGACEQAAPAPRLQAPRPEGELRASGRGGAAPRGRRSTTAASPWWTRRWAR